MTSATASMALPSTGRQNGALPVHRGQSVYVAHLVTAWRSERIVFHSSPGGIVWSLWDDSIKTQSCYSQHHSVTSTIMWYWEWLNWYSLCRVTINLAACCSWKTEPHHFHTPGKNFQKSPFLEGVTCYGRAKKKKNVDLYHLRNVVFSMCRCLKVVVFSQSEFFIL